jgi:hypothetical protein
MTDAPKAKISARTGATRRIEHMRWLFRLGGNLFVGAIWGLGVVMLTRLLRLLNNQWLAYIAGYGVAAMFLAGLALCTLAIFFIAAEHTLDWIETHFTRYP